MDPGTTVRLKADPGRVGIITGKVRERAGKKSWQVRFPDGASYYREVHLEVLSEVEEDPVELLQKGKLGRARDLRGNLTHIRLTGRLANLIYSMDTTNTDFYAYQFKPVLNFLDAPSNGLLIADEVGLGKTIEAGLIWTELRSRFDIRRVMVLCPAMLQEKWQDELRIRLGIEAAIIGVAEVHKRFLEYREGDRFEYAIISSMQGMRPRRGWDKGEEKQDNASLLARFLEENQYGEPFLDLLIIDEAHYLRNPESMTSRLGQLLRAVSDYVLLLSATPVHLRSRDLYQLLNLVDESTFNQPQIFDEILEANEPLLRARDAVLTRTLDQSAFLELMNQARRHPFFAGNRQIKDIIDNPPTDEELRDEDFRSALADRLEGINLLGRIVNRTRKRDVTEWRVVREVVPEVIPLSEPEQRFYKRVTGLVREYALRGDGIEAFLLVMPQRQMSSSMPAALHEWLRRGRLLSEQVYEDFGEHMGDEEIGPLTYELVNAATEMGDYEELRANDSKYDRLRRMLTTYLNRHPNDKVVLFSYFRPTLHYLSRRLREDGIGSITLMGGSRVDKHEILRTFQKPSGPQVLLSSEVASEGIDLQFSRVLINYDLPWNPMKVEQRIGRLDRLGQRSEKITIWNLFYADTIDARIYDRLYERLHLFERSLGGLEPVLGDEIRRLTEDLLLADLTPEQEEARISQTEQAIAIIKAQEEKLEEEAGNLVAHGHYILDQIRAARELERTITSKDLFSYTYDFFLKEYVGSEFIQLDPDELVFDVKLTEKAKFEFDSFVKKNHLQRFTRLNRFYPEKVRCRFRNKVGSERTEREEIISQFHPLVRFVSEKISDSAIGYYSPVSVELNRQDIPGIAAGVYVFAVERWSVQGLRDIERLHVEVRNLNDASVVLTDEEAERLVTNAARQGKDWLSAPSVVDLDMAVGLIEECMDESESKYEKYIRQLWHENNDRADIQEKSLRHHQDRQLEKLEGLLSKQQSEGKEAIARMTQGRIDALKGRMEQKLLEINRRRELRHHKQEICIGLIRVC